MVTCKFPIRSLQCHDRCDRKFTCDNIIRRAVVTMESDQFRIARFCMLFVRVSCFISNDSRCVVAYGEKIFFENEKNEDTQLT